MRKVLAAAALLAIPILAGCLQQEPAPAGTPYATADQVRAGGNFTAFLCKGGVRLAANVTDAVDECNHRVTKPLLDNASFDWRTQHGPANEVSVAIDPTNPLHVAGGGKDYTVSYLNGFQPTDCGQYTVWMGAYSSSDGGVTWADDLMPGFPGDPRKSPLTGNLCSTDPVAVFGDDGTFYFSGLNYQGKRAGSGSAGIPPDPLFPGSSDLTTASQLYFARSHDGGATFPTDEMGFCAVGDNGAQFNDKQWFAVQPKTQHIIATWTPYYTGPPAPAGAPADPTGLGLLAQSGSYISYCESDDGGRTWGPQRLFAPSQGLPVNAQFSMPAYLPAGRPMDVAVIWALDTDSTLPSAVKDFQADELSYTEGRATPSGTVFQPALSSFEMDPVKSSPARDGTGPSTFRVSTYPVLAVDTSGGTHNGRRYVVWADQKGPVDTDVQVLMRHSDDGLSWSEPVTVNDVERGDQFVPWVSVDPKGGVHVAWLDRRNDPSNRLLDVYYAYSDDGGERFHRNVRVTERSFDGDLGHHQGGFPFIGDYIGLATSASSAVVFWADTRHADEPGRMHQWPGAMAPTHGSDVYSATIIRDADAMAVFRPAPTG
ncbi:MAG: hypothetical protein ABR562_08925 [Thermoplasmatota archaeon]